MKSFKALAACVLILFLLTSFLIPTSSTDPIRGAWQFKAGPEELLMIIEDEYYSITSFNPQQRKFNYTKGGVMKLNGTNAELKLEFHSLAKDSVGKTVATSYKLNDGLLTADFDGQKREWKLVDNQKTDLTGCWRINRRGNDARSASNPRKTLKILSGTKFQWMAINASTGEFFGTGGGTYTFEEGKYTEQIEFFSRDSSRVGASLTFDGKVENMVWKHSGLSSTGKPVNEEWIKH
jgi:hypothetical protein